MKKLFSFFTAAMAIILLTSCGGGNGNNPKDVARNFFEAIKTFNIEEASKYATKDSKSMLDLMKMGMSFAPKNMDSIKNEMAKQKIEYSEPVINGDEATVSITVDGKDKTDFKLKKEEGQWKVAFDKNSLMESGMEKMQDEGASEEDLKQAEEAMKMLRNGGDSLKQMLEGAGKTVDSLNQ